MIARDACVVCGESRLENLLHIPAYPVFQGCVAGPRGTDETAAMNWKHCGACGSAQITPLPLLEHIYQAGHATGLGAAWARHHAAFAQFLKENACGAIADVGGGSGTLAIAYRGAGGAAPYAILEPNALRADGLPPDIAVVDGFLEEAALKLTGANTVVMCHMFEHALDLRVALTAINAALPSGGRLCLAWPELEYWTAKGVAGGLNFEHGIYVTVPRLLALLAEFGWRQAARQRWDENDTLFLAMERGPAPTDAAMGNGQQAVPAYFSRLRALAEEAQRSAQSHDGDVFLMPASVYSQALLSLGLEEQSISGLLDNAPAKQGRRLYGTSLIARPVTTLTAARNPLVILNAGAHNAEIAVGLRALRPDVHIAAAN